MPEMTYEKWDEDTGRDPTPEQQGCLYVAVTALLFVLPLMLFLAVT